MVEKSWGQVRHELLNIVGQNNFKSWIEPLALASVEDGVARFEAPTRFMRDWVSRNYAEHIRHLLVRSGVAVERVEFHVSTPRPAQTPHEPARKSKRADLRGSRPEASEGAVTSPDRRFTFQEPRRRR